MKHFNKFTSIAKDNKHNALIMGRLSYEGIPKQYLPFDGPRESLVICSSLNLFHSSRNSVQAFNSIDSAIDYCQNSESSNLIDKIFICGGSKIYQECSNLVDFLIITRVNKKIITKANEKKYIGNSDSKITKVDYTIINDKLIMNNNKFKIIKQSHTFVHKNMNYDIIVASRDAVPLDQPENEYFDKLFYDKLFRQSTGNEDKESSNQEKQ
mmetsp:Transcript_74354/g.160786  ORF Transcript_74354/g.160786 Transcript_74354/m.160786 type:complete len:211 (+) Transcript_74354:106-738(+)